MAEPDNLFIMHQKNILRPKKSQTKWKANTDLFNPTAPRKAKIVYNFGLSECNRVKLADLLNTL